MDSLDQGARDIPAGSVTVRGDALEVALPQIDGRYTARVTDGALKGIWTQHGKPSPLDFVRQPGGPSGPAPEGSWQGTLQVRLTVVLHVERTATGWTATADSPDQHAAGLPVDAVTVSGKPSSSPFRASTRATPRTSRASVWSACSRSTIEPCRSSSRAPTIRRPSPRAPRNLGGPCPTKSSPSRFPAAPKGVTLACTLTKPNGAGPFAAVVLATGSGPQDRDETLMGHKPFLVLSDAITRAGLAVLRCDDRGHAASTGTFATATTLDFAQDALAAVAWLRARPDVARDRVGIVGHSEGATVAAIAAADSRDVAFIVMLAGPALPGARHLEPTTCLDGPSSRGQRQRDRRDASEMGPGLRHRPRRARPEGRPLSSEGAS